MIHIKRIDEVAGGKQYTCIVESDTKDIDRLWAVAVCTENDNEYSALAQLSYGTRGEMSFEFTGEWASGREEIECYGKTLDYKRFRRMFNDDIKGSKRLHRYTMKNPVGDMYEHHIYGDRNMGDVIELSDRPVLDGITRPYVHSEWERACEKEIRAFERKFGTELYRLGRSGRHLCVENTRENRVRFLEMLEEIDRALDRMLEAYNGMK